MKNRRNYYRILQVQPDAAADVIKASYRTLMQKLKYHPDLGGDEWNATVINEAWAVLSDPTRRAAYDAGQRSQVMGVGAINRASRKHRYAGATHAHGSDKSARRSHSGFESLTCVLCKRVTNIATALPGPRRCHSCQSPLTRAHSVVPDDPGKRALPRLERSAPVRFLRTDHARKVHQALLEDLSPQGMRLVTEIALEVGELLRIECDLLSAVARVIVSRRSDDLTPHYITGIEFITVDFAHWQGSLIATSA